MASPAANSGPTIRFGVFEADLRTGELRKHGTRIKLQEQPFQILAMLLEHPGELVTREQIQQRLWAADTFVDFDHSLNTAVARLRDALGDSAENPRWIETLPRRGYRFVGPLANPMPAPVSIETGRPPQPAPPVEEPQRPSVPRSKRWLLLTACVLVLAALSYSGWRLWHREVAQSIAQVIGRESAIDSVAVLPLVNATQNPDLDYLGDGIAESIMSNLSQVRALRVMSRNSAFRYRGSGVDPAKAARELGVRSVLLGTLRQRGDNLHITLELVDARNERQLWGAEYDRKVADMLRLQEEISRETADRLLARLANQTPFRRHTASPEAYELYLRGRYAIAKRVNKDILEGMDFFRRAVEADPRYAQAYVGMSAAYGLLAFYGGMTPLEANPKALLTAQRALELDPDSPDSHIQMGYAWEQRRHYVEAEQEWKRAIELEPNSADAHHAYSMFLANRNRYDEAVREANLNEKLDPLWAGSYGTSSWILYYAGRYQEAEQRAQRFGTGFPPAHMMLGLVYSHQHRYAEAIAQFEQLLALAEEDGFSKTMLVAALAGAGQTERATTMLAEIVKQRKRRYYSATNIAAACVALADNRAAIEWLHTADRERDPWLLRIATDPRFEPLRSLPEFAEIQRSVNTPD